MKMTNVLMFGPTGVGKSELAKCFVDKQNFLHISFDRSDEDSMDGDMIHDEWTNLRDNNSALPLKTALDYLVSDKQKRGSIVTYPSSWTIDINNILDGQKHGILTRILFGPKEDIYRIWSIREKAAGRDYSMARWKHNNNRAYNKFAKHEFKVYRLSVFENHEHRRLQDLMTDVL